MPASPAPQRPAYRPARRPQRPSAVRLDPDMLPDETDLTQIRISLTANIRPRRSRARSAH